MTETPSSAAAASHRQIQVIGKYLEQRLPYAPNMNFEIPT
jgi:hypothetical protein